MESSCDTLFMCIITTLKEGVRAGGGISDVLRKPTSTVCTTYICVRDRGSPCYYLKGGGYYCGDVAGCTLAFGVDKFQIIYDNQGLLKATL